MKKVFLKPSFLWLLITLVFGFVICWLGSPGDSHPQSPLDPISTDSAVARVQNYGKWIGSIGRLLYDTDKLRGNSSKKPQAHDFISGWTVDTQELKNLLEVHGDSPRISVFLVFNRKIELDTNFISTLDQGMSNLHLLLAPYGYTDPKTLKAYDLIKPCPNMCDSNAFLYKKYGNGFLKGFNKQ